MIVPNLQSSASTFTSHLPFCNIPRVIWCRRSLHQKGACVKQCRTQLFFLPADQSITESFTTGVSLHSHTEHSKEKLADLPRYLERMPVVSQFLQWERKRYLARTGRTLDFARAYWRGPLSAQAAYDLERRQIESMCLHAMVSLTDHDNLDAGMLLQTGRPAGEIPVSLEWTVPFEQTYFHMGIHNIAPAQAETFMELFANYTREPHSCPLGQILEMLDADSGVLTVLNHPLWDMKGIGSEKVLDFVQRFLRRYGSRIHALEINGLRTWQENMAAVSLARESGHPVVSGGDRHGLEPNAMINLTSAATFKEFAEEIRIEQVSNMAIQPQYREPLALRHLLTAWDAVREHPQSVERERWVARVFVTCPDGIERPLSEVWKGGAPSWIDPCLNVIGILASPQIRAAARMAVPAAGSTAL